MKQKALRKKILIGSALLFSFFVTSGWAKPLEQSEKTQRLHNKEWSASHKSESPYAKKMPSSASKFKDKGKRAHLENQRKPNQRKVNQKKVNKKPSHFSQNANSKGKKHPHVTSNKPKKNYNARNHHHNTYQHGPKKQVKKKHNSKQYTKKKSHTAGKHQQKRPHYKTQQQKRSQQKAYTYKRHQHKKPFKSQRTVFTNSR